MSTDAKEFSYATSRLGIPGEIANSAAREYRQQRFSGRHPLLTFVLLPILTLPLVWSASFFCLVLGAKGLGFDSEAFSASQSLSQKAAATAPFVVMGILLATIAVVAVFYCRLATRAAVSWKWTLATCAILALIGGTAFTSVTLPTAGSRGSLAFGFGVSQHPSPQQLLQFALPLSIGCWAIYRQLNRGRRALTNSG